MSMPLVIAALFFAVLATVEWNRLPLVARVYLGVATAFLLGARAYPGMSPADAVNQARDGIGMLLGVARAAGFAAVMVSLGTALRGLVAR